MKKWLSLILSVVLMSITVQTAFAAESEAFNLDRFYPIDVEEHWASNVLNDFVQADILNGYNEGGEIYLKPDAMVTRAEFVTLLLKAVDPVITQESSGDPFNDVKSGDWYYKFVSAAKTLGIVSGVDSAHFAPNRQITRAEISAVVSRFFKSTIDFNGTPVQFKDIEGNWAKDDIKKLSSSGIAGGYADGTFHPEKTATRAEAITLMNRAFHKESSNLPSDETLINVVKQANNEQFEALKNDEYDQIKQSIEKNNVGFARDAQLFSADLLKSYKDSGMKLEYNMLAEMNGQVISKSDRFATVKMTGGELEVKVTQGKTVTTTTIGGDETYYLRKMHDGWKIYGAEEEYNSDDMTNLK